MSFAFNSKFEQTKTMRSHLIRRQGIGLALTFAIALMYPALAAAQLDDEDFPPGLLARYTVGERAIERVDADISFNWGSAAADVRLPDGKFSAVWTGNLLLRREAKFQFHTYVEGSVQISIDGEQVLDAKNSDAGWATGKPVTLAFGETPIQIEFQKTAEAARLKLFWSSDSFGLEPLPAHLLFRDESSRKLAEIERGRIAFDVHRCNRCHIRKNDLPSPSAPSLEHVAAGLSDQHLIQQLRDPAEYSAHARMPTFGFDEAQAKSVVAFIASRSQPVKLQPPGKTKEKDLAKDRRQGEILLRSVGCLACHTHEKQGQIGPWGGGDLSKVGEKRSAAWLNSWLSDPAKLNADHRMPNMKLSSTERRQLVLFLATKSSPATPSTQTGSSRAAGDKSLIAAGRQLVETARCAACHAIDGLKADLSDLPDLSQAVDDWSNTCITARPDLTIGRPLYTAIDRAAVRSYVESRVGPVSVNGAFARGQQVLERRNCLACHPRGGSKGIVDVAGKMARVDADLQGKSQGLIPPALNAVGDKLLDAALAEAVSGDRKDRRLPWLMVRMPRFKHGEAEKRDLLTYLIGHDRIPDKAPATIAATNPGNTDAAQTLVVGHTLVGPKGFSCIACHQVGSYVPRNVALGTRGSDLMGLGKRMRKDFYIRWTRSPARIVPGMEMPSYIKAAPNVLDEDIDRQLIATWDALNDPKFTPPTNPSAVEQFWIVQPGEPARIVRDVFTDPNNDKKYIARSFAIGLNNGHNILFDLDTMSLRAWTFGDFARQRTQGKSWYWDMAGVPVMTGIGTQSDFALLLDGKPGEKATSPLLPIRHSGAIARLKDYEPHQSGVRFRYELKFEIEGKPRTIVVAEEIRPNALKSRSWDRRITASQVPLGYRFVVGWTKPATGVGNPTIVPYEFDSAPDDLFGSRLRISSNVQAGRASAILPPQSSGDSRGLLRYRSPLKTEPGQLKLKPAEPPQLEKVTSTPGFDGVRLPISRAIMPTAMTFTPAGKLAFTSLKGDVYIADDSDGDGVQDRLTLFEQGLASPFGIIADGDDLIVSHKPEVLRLRDTDGDGRADQRTVIASGWGYNDNYHDWACGIVRDKQGNLYIGLGSDYAQKSRPQEQSRWRGKVLQIAPGGKVTPIGHSFRYPTGLAMNAAGDIFVSDNQGVQNTFNEINHLVAGRHYGVPSRHEPDPKEKAYPPAIQVPHPWSRSVNGMFFLPKVGRALLPVQEQATGKSARPTESGGLRPPLALLADHGIGCEYDSRFLVRFTTQQVGDVMQGAAYYFSRPNLGAGGKNFVGPICGAVAPNGDIYIGSIYDSGWLGGQNTGAITRLRANGEVTNGIRELRATSDGFEIEFLNPIDATKAAKSDNYTISGYTRVWGGSYATPDSGRHRATVTSAVVTKDGRTVRLKVDGRREGHVYEVSCGRIGTNAEQPLFPATGHYTLHKIPR